MSIDFEDWKPIKEILSSSRKTMRQLIETHFIKIQHDEERKKIEIEAFSNLFRFVTRKWNVEILYELEIHNGLTFNDLRRHLRGVSARTLSDNLKQLSDYHLVFRNVQDTRPPSVLYTLGDEGKGFIELSIILMYYLWEIQSNSPNK